MKTIPEYEGFIQEMIQRTKGLFTEDDFKECKQTVTDFAEIFEKLEAIQTKFRRKLSDEADHDPQDREKIIYLQGIVDGINLIEGPLRRFKGAH